MVTYRDMSIFSTWMQLHYFAEEEFVNLIIISVNNLAHIEGIKVKLNEIEFDLKSHLLNLEYLRTHSHRYTGYE